jgi:hypothetical protein
LSACGRRGDVASGLDIQLVASGWRAAERASGKNKLVPSASVKVTNVSGRTLPSVQVNAVFRRVGEGREWGSAFVTAAGSSGLAPGGGATLTLNSERGYTGEDPEDAMLRNREFVDVTVDVFAKYGSQQWAHVGGFSIDRQLLR